MPTRGSGTSRVVSENSTVPPRYPWAIVVLAIAPAAALGGLLIAWATDGWSLLYVAVVPTAIAAVALLPRTPLTTWWRVVFVTTAVLATLAWMGPIVILLWFACAVVPC